CIPDTTTTPGLLDDTPLGTLQKIENPGGPGYWCPDGIPPLVRSEGGSGHLRSLEGPTLPSHSPTTALLRPGLKVLGLLLLSAAVGCSHERCCGQQELVERILPPIRDPDRELAAPPKTTAEAADEEPVEGEQPQVPDRLDAGKPDLSPPAHE